MQTGSSSSSVLPEGTDSEFLVVDNVDDKKDFATAIRESAKGSGASHNMVLVTRSRFLVDLLSYTASPEAISAAKTGEDLMKDDDLYKKLREQLGIDIPRQDVFVRDDQCACLEEFLQRAATLIAEAGEAVSPTQLDKQKQELLAEAKAQQGWLSWGAGLAMKTLTLGFAGGVSINPAAITNLRTPEGKEMALRLAVSCAQQGALAIILDGIQAQFGDLAGGSVSVGECSALDIVPTRRSCVTLKRVGSCPIVEVRKLLRIFRVTPAGAAVTVFICHTLLTVPLIPEGKHDVALEWKVVLPEGAPVPSATAAPAPVSVAPTPAATALAGAAAAAATVAQPYKQAVLTPPAPRSQQQQAEVPLIVAERLPSSHKTAPLTDAELAAALQRAFDQEEGRQRDEQLKRDEELARSLMEDPPGQVPTLLEEAVARVNARRGGGRRRNSPQAKAAASAAAAAAAAVVADSTDTSDERNPFMPDDMPDATQLASDRRCQCLGASAGFHKQGCHLRE